MKNRASNDFDRVLRASEVLAENLTGHVFIGGVAVYLHTVNSRYASYAEASHDSDVVVSLDDAAFLRDKVEVVTNRRLRKNQVMIEGIEIDVYVEHNNGLAVPYDELYAYSSPCGSLRIACPEHLMVLKLAASLDRRGSSKGDKDERDLVRLAVLGTQWRPELVEPYVGGEHHLLLKQVARSRVFSEMCERNDHTANKLRRSFESFLRTNF